MKLILAIIAIIILAGCSTQKQRVTTVQPVSETNIVVEKDGNVTRIYTKEKE